MSHHNKMYVLGIETSCDETAAAVVKNGKEIISSEYSSSLRFHRKYGGVIPEIASRQQLETITKVTYSALKESGVKLNDIGLISVTSGPGLLGSLLVGISFAKSLSLGLNIPLLGVNHLYGHIYANFLQTQMLPRTDRQTRARWHSVTLPAVGLVISGGHTSLFYVEDFDKLETLGTTLDDACGEAFDKVAKILGLGYPGGPIIERIASRGNPDKIKFNCSDTEGPLDFSFSGIKTAVLYYLRNHPVENQAQRADIAASFQDTMINTLIKKALLACKIMHSKNLLIGGGVAANSRLRERFAQSAKNNKIRVCFPAKELCMDNAAMIAGLGYKLFNKGSRCGLELNATFS